MFGKNSLAVSADFKQQEHLTIYMDVNGTIIAADKANNKGLDLAIWQLLCEKHGHRNYVDKHLCPEKEIPADPTQTVEVREKLKIEAKAKLKKERQAKYMEFVSFLKEHNPALAKEVEKEFNLIKEKLTKQNLFQSFIKLINYLETNKLKYSLVFRTFGEDLKDVLKEFTTLTSLECKAGAEFIEGKLKIDDGRVLSQPTEIHQYFKSFKVVAVKDHHEYWSKHKEEHEFGKPFFHDGHSIFFDDNSKDKKILCIVPLHQSKLVSQQLMQNQLIESGHIIPVNTLESILNPNYFIEHVERLLKRPRLNQHSSFAIEPKPIITIVDKNQNNIKTSTFTLG